MVNFIGCCAAQICEVGQATSVYRAPRHHGAALHCLGCRFGGLVAAHAAGKRPQHD